MATGDIGAKIALLKRDLSQIRYPNIFDDEGARQGRWQTLQPILNFVLHKFSPHVAAIAASYQLTGRERERRYLEGVFKMMRNEFPASVRARLTSTQFLAEVRVYC